MNTHIYTLICMHVYIYDIYANVYTDKHVYTCMPINTYIHTYAHTSVYIDAYICLHI